MPSLALADVAPPPTLIVDSLWFGPLGVLVLAGIIAVSVLVFRRLRRRRSRGVALAVAVAVYIALDLVVYAVALTSNRPSRPPVSLHERMPEPGSPQSSQSALKPTQIPENPALSPESPAKSPESVL